MCADEVEIGGFYGGIFGGVGVWMGESCISVLDSSVQSIHLGRDIPMDRGSGNPVSLFKTLDSFFEGGSCTCVLMVTVLC